MIVKTSAKPAPTTVEIKPFHKDVAAACFAHVKAGDTMRIKLANLLTSRYGECMPNIAQYTADQAALAELAKAKGLVDNQWVRKPYAAAVRALYGALPVSLNQESLAKAATRRDAGQAAAHAKTLEENKDKPQHVREALAAEAAALVKKTKVAEQTAPVGAPAGKTQNKDVSPAERYEQIITEMGLFNALETISRILAADKSTSTQAKTIAALDNQLRGILKPAKVA